jgi:glutamine amidotransferase
MNLVIIDYGAGNIQSLKFAFRRLGLEAELSADAATIKAADKVIFPGVGEASSAMRKLKASGIDRLIPDLKQPVLGICLGMQLMCNWCEEGDTQGLQLFDTDVIRFDDTVKVPHIGWNQITDLKGLLFQGIEENDFMYLVHSFYVPLTAETIATTHYGVPFSSGLSKDNFYGLQFHPEKSGQSGARILQNFLDIKD